MKGTWRAGRRQERGARPSRTLVQIGTLHPTSVSMFRLVFPLIFLVASSVFAGEPPFPAAERTTMLAGFNAQITALDRTIERMPGDVALHSRRGDCRLFVADFAGAVADFEAMIALDPMQDAPHWRLGIAYYFNGQHAKAARQFEKYHAHDHGDRENGIWKYLSDVPVVGPEAARRTMLEYKRFDREPFPALYELLAGAITTRAFFATLTERQLTHDPKVMFFAHYYAGLHEEILGRHPEALALLHQAVASPWGRTAEGGPAYMWQAARLHFEKLAVRQP